MNNLPRWRRHLFRTLLVILGMSPLGLGIISGAENAPVPNPSFESGETLPDSWQVEGAVSLDSHDAIKGRRSLRLERDPVLLPPTRAESDRFVVSPGVWELSGTYASDLHSPDVSFNVSISLKSFDAVGKRLKERRLVAASGQTPWKLFKERLEIPSAAVAAALEIKFNKTHGSFRVDNLALNYVGASIPMEGGDRKTVFKTNRVGNLFYPGDRVRFAMTLETPAELSEEQLRVDWLVTDFYSAPVTSRQQARLTPAGKSAKGWNLYRTVLDASALPLGVGPYYEVQAMLDLGAGSPARETFSFAILPEAATTHLDPLATPFGAHTWNATVYKYFPLAARLGLRRCLVFWDWPHTAPYTPNFDRGHRHDSRLGWPRRFGLAPYGIVYPIMESIEHHNGPAYSDEALRAGIRQSIEKYKQDGLWGFQIGNEPPSFNPEWVKRDVQAYKIAYETIKQTDPDFVVIGSAIGPNEAFFKAGFQEYQDVYNLHAYSDLGELRLQMRKYRELFKKYGGEKPIWSTEIGSKSQGLPRDVIARDIVRKAVCFFADGGGFFTWFAVGGMPDPEGERTGSYSDSMDLFAAKYNMHQPRVDAVAFYHLINTLAAKKFVEEVAYSSGEHGFLFRDEHGNSLLVFWTDGGDRDVFVPLPGVHEVGLTWTNGSTRRLDAHGRGLTLRLREDPVLLSFRSERTPLPAAFDAAPAAVVAPLPPGMLQGQVADITVRVTDERILNLSGPAGWDISAAVETRDADGLRRLAYRVSVPDDTTARVATFTLSDETASAPGDVELRFAVPVQSQIGLDVTPVAGAREGDSSIRLRWENRSEKPQPVDWKVEIVDELPMENGTYKLTDAKPSTAFFGAIAADRLTLAPRETRELTLPLNGTDRQTLYRLRATATDANGNTVQRERRVGGFGRVVRAKAPPVLDGRLDDAAWRETPAYRLDEQRQFCAVEKSAKPWAGPQDLSGAVRFAWDDENLYVAVEAVDDVFRNPGADSRLWSQDGLQFLFDPFRNATQSRGRYDYSVGVGQKGPQAWCHMSADPSAPAGAAPQIKLAMSSVSEDRGDRIYEVAIPWTRLAPFRPARGANLGLTMVLNEDDGTGRKSTIGWFGGVHLKETNFVGDVILDE